MILISVVFSLERTFLRDADIISLKVGKFGQAHAKLLEMKACDLLVEVLRQHVNLVLVFALLGEENRSGPAPGW